MAKEERQSTKGQPEPSRLVPMASGQPTGERSSNVGVFLFSALVFSVVLSLLLLVGIIPTGTLAPAWAVLSFTVAVLATMTVHIAQQWERVVVLRLGKFDRVAGPGAFLTIPFIE